MNTIIIDGKTLSADHEDTLLDIALNANIAIPNLCKARGNSPKTADKQHCNLCYVEIRTSDEQIDCVRACDTRLGALQEQNNDQYPIEVITQSSELTKRRKAALTTILSDHFADCEAPCQTSCPAGVDIQSYLYHIAQGDHTQAVKVIKETLPLPLSIGRVCPAFCEAECRRGLVDEPIAIRQLKRHASDLDLFGDNPYVPPRAPLTNKKVAIIGSGPAGIAAGYYLSNNGHDVTIFESMPKAGGWLRYGIPEYRLPKDILDKEIDLLCANGLEIKTNTRLGRDIQLNGLMEDFDAVCLAIGAQKAVPMNYPGIELDGCYLGVDYLKDYCTKQAYTTGKKVAVIGGGNTAIDCARTAKRDGADVTLIYRRTKAEMPAEDYEIHEAEQEGIKFHFLTNPIENHSDEHGRVSSVTFDIMALGEPDSSGRRSPKATGETFTEAFDTVIPAVSQTPDMEFLDHPESQLATGKIALTRWNTFAGCEHTMSAGVEGVDKLFVIGDSRRGPATAVAAVADGRKAADAIEKLLTDGLTCELTSEQFNSSKTLKTNDLNIDKTADGLNPFYPAIKPKNRLSMPELTALQRTLNFAEVELGFAPDEAMLEAARCLECACQANTDCKLRDYATEYKIDGKKLDTSNAQHFAVDDSAPFITFDANRCISCGACVETCHGNSGHNAISFEKDHYTALPIDLMSHREATAVRNAPRAGFSASMQDSDCVQCGNCVQVCPTGALVDARDKTQGVKEKFKTVSTICTYCGIGCRVNLHVDIENNQIRHVSADSDSPVNEGMLCVKGRFGFDFINSEKRLTTPLMRKNGELVSASWDEALGFIATKLTKIKQEHGRKSIAGLASAKATNEDNYLFQKFFRTVIGNNNVDHCARLCHASTVTALRDTLGSGSMTNNIPDIKNSDLILIMGSDTSNAHPIIASRIKEAVRDHGARLVVIDPKKIDIADHAQLYAAQRPGTDVMLINALMQQIIKHNWHDMAYIEKRVEGFDAIYAEVMKTDYSLENAELVTGIARDTLAEIAKLIGTASKTAIYYAMGITQHTSGHDNVTAISNLQLLCGNVGVSGAGINPLRGQSNVQGSCDMGALPHYFTGYQEVDNPAFHAKFSKYWNMPDLCNEIGMRATQMMHGLAHGKLKALYVMGENPVLSDPDQRHVLEGLDKAELLVVQDIFLTETAELADVVLPAAAFAEKVGHFTNTERRVQQLLPAVNAPGQARNDWDIIQEVAQRMGADWDYADEKAIWQEVTEVTPQYQGISWDRVDSTTAAGRKGLQWPCRDNEHKGTEILHQGTFVRGPLAKMRPVEYRLPAEMPCEEYPLTLSTGRLLEQFHTGTLTRKTEGLDQLGAARVTISAFDADKQGIRNGDMLTLTTRRGEINMQAFVTKRAQAGVVFLPFHFAEAAANKLTNNALDPVAKIPEFKVCAVRIEKAKVAESNPNEALAEA